MEISDSAKIAAEGNYTNDELYDYFFTAGSEQRSSIKYQANTELDLFFLIKTAYYHDKCCSVTVINDFCNKSANAITRCRIIDLEPDSDPVHVMLKVIANPYVFSSFSESDDSTDPENTKKKGIEVIKNNTGWMGQNIANKSNYFQFGNLF